MADILKIILHEKTSNNKNVLMIMSVVRPRYVTMDEATKLLNKIGSQLSGQWTSPKATKLASHLEK